MLLRSTWRYAIAITLIVAAGACSETPCRLRFLKGQSKGAVLKGHDGKETMIPATCDDDLLHAQRTRTPTSEPSMSPEMQTVTIRTSSAPTAQIITTWYPSHTLTAKYVDAKSTYTVIAVTKEGLPVLYTKPPKIRSQSPVELEATIYTNIPTESPNVKLNSLTPMYTNIPTESPSVKHNSMAPSLLDDGQDSKSPTLTTYNPTVLHDSLTPSSGVDGQDSESPSLTTFYPTALDPLQAAEIDSRRPAPLMKRNSSPSSVPDPVMESGKKSPASGKSEATVKTTSKSSAGLPRNMTIFLLMSTACLGIIGSVWY